MKKLILILLALSIAPQLMAQQTGKVATSKDTKTSTVMVDTPHLVRPPQGATIEDLISKLQVWPQDTSSNAARIRIDCRDVFQAVKPGDQLSVPEINYQDPSAIKGIVADASGTALPGSKLKLQSGRDSIVTETNAAGRYLFRSINAGSYVLTASAPGYRLFIKQVILGSGAHSIPDTIKLTSKSIQLVSTPIVGRLPIIYKEDTIQYRTAGYKVRIGAKLNNLLSKMEGFEVDSASSVSHQGSLVTVIKVSGKLIPKLSLSEAIHTIPADDIDLIEVIDDYGDNAARTGGGRSPNPDKHLNIILKKGKSINLKKLRTGRSK